MREGRPSLYEKAVALFSGDSQKAAVKQGVKEAISELKGDDGVVIVQEINISVNNCLHDATEGDQIIQSDDVDASKYH